MNRGTEILNEVKSMSLEEYDKLYEDSQHLADIHIADIGTDASLAYKQAIHAENIYENFVLEAIAYPIMPYANAAMYTETDDRYIADVSCF